MHLLPVLTNKDVLVVPCDARCNHVPRDIPAGFKEDFVAESEESKARLNQLKNRVRASGLEVFDRWVVRQDVAG